MQFEYADSAIGPTRTGLLAARSLAALRAGDIAGAKSAADAGRLLADVAAGRDDAAGLAELGWAESWLERYPQADAHLQAAIAVARRTGAADLLPQLLVALAHVACWTGRLPEAVRLTRGARRHGGREVRGAAAALESIATLWIGGQDSPARSLELARVAVGESGLDGWWGRVALASLGQARLTSGDAAGAVRLVLDAGRDTELSGLPTSLRPMWFSLLCSAALRGGDVDLAEVWAQRADAMRRHVGLPGQRAFAAMAAGQVLLRRGDSAGAAGRMQSAAAGFGQSGMRVLQGMALVVAGRATAADGDPESARHMVQQAHRVATGCGAQRIVNMAAEAMRRITPVRTIRVRHPPAAQRAGGQVQRSLVTVGRPVPMTSAVGSLSPAADDPLAALTALTARERQIAWIAGSGTKTSSIARQLGVSPRTVDVHLSRIYRKLEVPGRAGLVAIVARMDPGGASAVASPGPPRQRRE